MQTSTITVACLEVPREHEMRIDPSDLDWQMTKGSGPGGQHRNKTETAVRLTHRPTGIVVCSESERSQHQNKETALAILRSRLLERQRAGAAAERNRERRQQVGTGMRGDKIRTVALQRDDVTDHVLDRRMNAKDYLRGRLEPFYD